MHSELVDQKYLHTHTHVHTGITVCPIGMEKWYAYLSSIFQSITYLSTYLLFIDYRCIYLAVDVQLYVHYLTCMKSSV